MKKILLGLSVAGLLFSGYVSALKLFSHTCAFGSSCPYFLGYPACYFGFVLFLVLTFFAVEILRERDEYIAWEFRIGLLALAYALYILYLEWPLWKAGIAGSLFGLPTCVWGFLFFAGITSIAYLLGRKDSAPAPLEQ